MAQGSYTLANQAGAAFRAAVNVLTGIIRSRNSGSSAPGETAADMLWVDTTNNVVKRRNSGDSAWVLDGSRADSPTRSTSTGITLAVSDHKRGVRVTGSGGITLAFTAAATLTDGWRCEIRNDSTGKVTLDPNSSETIDGATTLVMEPGQSLIAWCDGSGIYTVRGGMLTSATVQATTSGTSKDFTGIPSWAKRITVMFNGVSTNGTSLPRLQLGISSGVETSGYIGNNQALTAGYNAPAADSSGFDISSGNASNLLYGHVVFCLQDASTNTWTAGGFLAQSNGPTTVFVAGVKPLAGTLDRVRLTTVNGTDAFDAGSVNILYE